MQPRRLQAGFTLLEVMVAVSIFALLGVGAYRLLSGEVRTQNRVQAHSETLRQWQRGLYRLQQDIVQISPRPVRDNYGDTEPAVSGTNESLTLTRTGWPNPLGRLRSHSQRVHYELGLPESHHTSSVNLHQRLALLRRYWQVLDRAQDSEPRVQILLPGIQSVQFRYLDTKGKWQNQWPPLTSGPQKPVDTALPTAIEVRFVSEVYGEISRLFNVSELEWKPSP